MAAVLDKDRRANQFARIKTWLCPPDQSTNLNKAQKNRQEGTGFWFLESNAFKEWKAGNTQHLWLHSIPGCGKTVLSGTIIEYLNQKPDSDCIVLNFFFNFTDTDKQSADKLVRSLLAQLYTKCKKPQEELQNLFLSCQGGEKQPTFESLCTTFMRIASYIERVQVVIDALDEYQTRKDLFYWMEKITQSGHAGLYIITTSRREEDIESSLKRWLHQTDVVPVQQENINRDIRLYIQARLNKPGFERWHSQPSVLDEIEIKLMEKANGMFRWAACQLDILERCVDIPRLKKRLRSLPETLEETYARILGSISETDRDYVIRILQFLVYSERPLTIQEAVDVIVVRPDKTHPFDPKLRMLVPRDILRSCSSLVSLITRRVNTESTETISELQLAHFSVQQYLKSKRLDTAFPSTMARAGRIFQKGLNKTNAKKSITRICLAYLSHLDEQRPIREVIADFPLAKYSAQYWMDHARPVEADKDVQKSILHFFAQDKQAYIIWGRLVDPDYPPDVKPDQYRKIATPIYYASSAGLYHTVKMLLQKGADINARGRHYGNALQAASAQGHKRIVQLLLEKGANINAPNGWYGNAITAASAEGHTKIVRLLLGKGANINAQGGYYSNALQAASEEGHTKTVQLLLEMGVDVNTHNWLYGDALKAACAGGYSETVQLLLKKGADIKKVGGYFGNTLQAAAAGGCTEIIQRLLDEGADVNAKGGEYGSALSAALKEGNTETVQLLLEKGANCDDTPRNALPRGLRSDGNQSNYRPTTSKRPAELCEASQASQIPGTSKHPGHATRGGKTYRKRRRVGSMNRRPKQLRRGWRNL